MLARIIVVIIAVAGMSGCGWIQEIPVMNFQKKEVEAIDSDTRTVLDALGYKGYQVFVFPHGSYHSPVLSQKTGSEMFSGDAYIPESPSDDNTNIPPGLHEMLGKKSSTYAKDETIANFSDREGIGYNLDYVSVLLVFDSLAPGESETIKSLLKGTVLNSQRGDNVVITIKKAQDKK
ncbi:MAG: hypothetical protein HPY53_10305 [Brevinematales bacterium]|nr:hypothetical protein [Brevinematales bacterium]